MLVLVDVLVVEEVLVVVDVLLVVEVVLVVDVVPAVPVRVALRAASSPLLSEPSASALRGEHLRRAIPQSQVSNPDLVLDSHGEECRPPNLCL